MRSASAWPAAGGIPWPDGPVLALKNSVLPAISAWPGSPPRRRSVSRSAGSSAQRPSSGNAKRSSPSSSRRARSAVVEHGERARRPPAPCGPRRARTGPRTGARAGGCPSAWRPRASARGACAPWSREPPGVPALAVVRARGPCTRRRRRGRSPSARSRPPRPRTGGLPRRTAASRRGDRRRFIVRDRPPAATSGSMTVRIRRRASDRFSRDVGVREPDVVRARPSRTPSRPAPTRRPR